MLCPRHGNRKQDAANCVECYVAEYNVTTEVAIAKISQMMEDAWKTTNKALLELRSLHGWGVKASCQHA
jgi:hypothetical protein